METASASQPAASRAPKWTAALKSFWDRAQSAIPKRSSRRLRLSETLSLGDRRFVALIQVDRQEFLMAGSGSSLVLLARLQDGTVVPETCKPRDPVGF